MTLMSPQTLRVMSYGLPAITVIFTYFLPAGLQLSFLVSGVLSFFQSSMFKNASFRKAAGMAPLPPPQSANPSSGSSTIKLAPEQYRDTTSLSYQAPNVTSTLRGVSVNSTPEVEKTMLGSMKASLSDGFKEAKGVVDSTKKTVDEKLGNARKDGKRTKLEIKSAEQYEKKRSAELQQKRYEDEQRRMAQRRAKKMAGR